jgi:hypothetical protein
VRDLNTLATKYGLSTIPVKTIGRPCQKLIQRLQTRCSDGATTALLRDAARRWQANGGFLDAVIIDPEPLAGGSDFECEEEGAPFVLPRHKVLQASFRLESKAFMLTYNSKSFDLQTWKAFQSFTKTTAMSLRATGWSACLEEMNKKYHAHAYYFWDNGEGVKLRNIDKFIFLTVRPRVDRCNVTHPPLFKKAAERGLWYVYVMKFGTIYADSNYMPWQQYVPDAAWLVSLWTARKMTHDQYEQLSATFRSGHTSRMQDLECVRRTERALAVRKHLLREKKDLEQIVLRAFRSYPEIEEFVAYFQRPSRRRPIFAIIGPTGTGKSELAAYVLRRICEILRVREFIEVTVGDNGSMDMSDFDIEMHGGILLDGVGDVQMLADHRETLQGRAKVDLGGKSSTMMYAYPFTLCRRAVVATLDNAASNLNFFGTHHWLSDKKNVIVLRLTAPAWM